MSLPTRASATWSLVDFGRGLNGRPVEAIGLIVRPKSIELHRTKVWLLQGGYVRIGRR